MRQWFPVLRWIWTGIVTATVVGLGVNSLSPSYWNEARAFLFTYRLLIGLFLLILLVLTLWAWIDKTRSQRRERNAREGVILTDSPSTSIQQNLFRDVNIGGDFNQLISQETSPNKVILTIDYKVERRSSGRSTFTIRNRGISVARDVIFRCESERQYAYLDITNLTEDGTGIKISELHPNISYPISIAFSGGASTVNISCSWKNPDGSPEEINQLLPPTYY